MKNLPKIRTDNLLLQETDSELLVFDLNTNKALCLNETSAKVWQLCDGKTSFDKISHKTQIPKEFVWVAIEEFQKNRLLEFDIETELPKDRVSRRKMLMKVGAVTVALPMIVGIIAPVSTNAQSAAMGTCTGPPGSPSGTALFGGNICGAPLADCVAACTPEGVLRCCSMAAILTPGCPNCRCVCT